MSIAVSERKKFTERTQVSNDWIKTAIYSQWRTTQLQIKTNSDFSSNIGEIEQEDDHA